MSMTRRDFEGIAQAMKDGMPETVDGAINPDAMTQWKRDLTAMGRYLQGTNPRFDLARFLEASGWEADRRAARSENWGD